MAKKADNRSLAQKEAAELEDAFNNAVGGEHAKNTGSTAKRRTALVVSIIVLIAVLTAGLVFGYLFFLSGVKLGKILNNVSIAGVDVGELSKEEAIQAVQNALGDAYQRQPMIVELLEDSVSLSPEMSGVNLDVEAAVNTAYAYGRTGSFTNRKAQQMLAANGGIQADLSDCITLNTDAVRAELQKLIDANTSELKQTTAEITGERPELTFDPEAASEEEKKPESDGQEEDESAQKLVITKGTRACSADIETVMAQVMDAYSRNVFQVTAACTVTEPDALDLDAIYRDNCVEPVDAVMDSNTFEVTPQKDGWQFDLENTKKLLDEAPYGETLEIPFTRVSAEVTYDSLYSQLFKDELSSYSTSVSYNADRNVNLRLACASINGLILNPGEVFDYNETLGERTPERGYRPGASYVGSETVYTYGGGICQVSSTLYYCALLADMEIVTRVEHGFASSYIPLGMDATVSWGGPHFRFRNNTAFPIRIEAVSTDSTVEIRILGTDTKDYYVEMEYQVLDVYNWETVYEEMPPDNPKGYKDGQTITTPYTGYLVKTYRCKYDKATNELISKEYEATSEYNRRNKKVCKIVDPNATEPTEPEVPETTAPENPGVPGSGDSSGTIEEG